MFVYTKNNRDISTYICTHRHTHTHTYIYIYTCTCTMPVCVCVNIIIIIIYICMYIVNVLYICASPYRSPGHAALSAPAVSVWK